MKKKLVAILIGAAIMIFAGTGCQATTKMVGDSMTIELEPNQKLEIITWKENSLWYLTRPMRDDEEAETHTFQQSSNFGIFEGTVTVIESRGE